MRPSSYRYALAWLGLFFMVLSSASASASDHGPRAFVPGSLGEILQSHHGRPFILALWSLDCAPCLQELALWPQVATPAVDIVLISTDLEADPAAIRKTLQKSGNQDRDSWVFAHEFEERLRYEIDPQWYGELPRTYFYRPDGTRQGRSGLLDEGLLRQWMTQQMTRQLGH